MNLYVSAILNFQAIRGRPLEYYTRPLNDLSLVQPNLVVFVDDQRTYDQLSDHIQRIIVDYEMVSDLALESSWRGKFLQYFNNDLVWYNLSRTYLLKPRLLKMAKEFRAADRYVWIDAGMPCSHIYGHDVVRYTNVYTVAGVSFIDEVFTKARFLTQGWVVRHQSGVDMQVVYDAFQLNPDGREHISGCIFSMESERVDKFNDDFYSMHARFHEINFMGTDENVYIAMLATDKTYCSNLYRYEDFMRNLTS